MMITPSIIVEDACYISRKKILLNIPSLVIKSEGLGVVVGKNGSGKTLLLHLLSGRLAMTEGRVSLANNDNVGGNLSDMMMYRKTIRFMPDRLMGDLSVTVKHYIGQIALVYHDFHRIRAKQDMEKVMHVCALERLAETMVAKLSLGEQRRLAIACTLLGESQYLFLDEPFTGLDGHHAHAMRSLLKQIAQKQSVVFSGHDLAIDIHTADHILWVKESSVTQQSFSPELGKKIEEDIIGD